MIIYEGTNNLVSGAFLECFSIFEKFISLKASFLAYFLV